MLDAFSTKKKDNVKKCRGNQAKDVFGGKIKYKDKV